MEHEGPADGTQGAVISEKHNLEVEEGAIHTPKEAEIDSMETQKNSAQTLEDSTDKKEGAMEAAKADTEAPGNNPTEVQLCPSEHVENGIVFCDFSTVSPKAALSNMSNENNLFFPYSISAITNKKS